MSIEHAVLISIKYLKQSNSPCNLLHKMSLQKSTRSLNSSSSFSIVDDSLFPDEILFHIFLHLAHEDLNVTARVCTKWNFVTCDSLIWRHRLLGLNDVSCYGIVY